MSIISLLEQIRNDEIVLPAIQRDFVWPEGKVEKLFDSIMRGYPIGIILLWETYRDIQHRYFERDYKEDTQPAFRDNAQYRRLRLVLDGQQRLQSLYIALYGTFHGENLYFDVLSGHENEDFKEDKFFFRFYDTGEVASKNQPVERAQTPAEITGDHEDSGQSYFFRVCDLVAMGAKERAQFRRGLSVELSLPAEDAERLDINLAVLVDALTNDRNILKTTTLDEDLPRDSKARKSESDVLEAFVRINREGTPLSRSDMVFSMLKLNWAEAAQTLPEFVAQVNKGNSFELDTDFVIRCLFAVCDFGAKFDIDLLRKKANLEVIKQNFPECCNAIQSMIDFVRDECWIASSKLLRGDANLVPIVYYLFHIPTHQVPHSQIDRVRKAVYLSGFTAPFSRYADSRLGKFIREALKPLADQGNETFPLEESLRWVWHWEKVENFGSAMVQRNPALALHLVQRRTGAQVKYSKGAPEIDHIFPRSVLRSKGLDDAQINHFANLWILSKSENRNKSNKPPKDYFRDVSDDKLARALIDRRLLEYGRFKAFLKRRETAILEHISNALNLSESDFLVRGYWQIE